MAFLGDLRTELSPAVEELLEDFDSSSPAPLSRRELVVELAGGAAFLAVVALMLTLISGGPEPDVPLALALIAAYALTARVRFAVGYGFTVPTQIVFVPMLFLLPAGLVPLCVVLAEVLGDLPEYARRRHPSRMLLSVGDGWHAVGPALVIGLAGIVTPSLSDWPVLLLALAAQLVFDFATSTVRQWLWLGVPPGLQPRLFAWVALVDVLLSPIGLLAAMAAAADKGYAALLVLPLAGLLGIFALERRARMDNSLELSRAYRGTTLLLSEVLDADDEYTGLHSRSVVSLSVAVSDELGLDSRERRNVEFGALLHDVGKIAVPNEIINKPGPLTDDEWLVIKAHTVEGQRMLDQVGGLLSDVGRVVRSSHERWDGGGYPDGLAGDEIPLESAIVACCDAFNAITTDRPYRPARSTEEAIAELMAESGKQFNPLVVRALTRILARSLAFGDDQPERPIGIVGVPVPVE
jgi:HD-GYP domain-containing protein (c-di-GMP phosphodiesterase class II)